MNFNLLKRWFHKEEPQAPKGKKMQRNLKGAIRNRYTNWLNATLQRANADINQDLITVITKCRDLAKNDSITRAYLGACQKNIIGKTGFELQCQMKKSENELDEKGKPINNFLTVDGGMGHVEFDALILRTLIIDGEVFIRIHKEAKNPYGLSFELIDAASIDYTKVREAAKGVNAIVLGVEVDKYYKPVAYYYRPR